MQQVNYISLNNGLKIPDFGFGTFPQKEELIETIPEAIRAGYRLFDISDNYDNEEYLGSVIRSMKERLNPLDDFFVVTKFSQPYRTNELNVCFAESEKKLAGKIDIYLLHWPYPFLWRHQWRKMEDLYFAGKCKAIGVCNFEIPNLKKLLKICRVPPAINQIERHPMFQQQEIVDFCKYNNIQVMAYSPVGRKSKELFDSNILKSISEKHSKTVSQIILRWDVDTGVIPIPSSRSSSHIVENQDILSFKLNQDEINRISKLESGKRIRFDPKTRFSIKEKLSFLLTKLRLFIPAIR